MYFQRAIKIYLPFIYLTLGRFIGGGSGDDDVDDGTCISIRGYTL